MMRYIKTLLLIVVLVLTGCRADVQTTDHSHRLEVEVPKVEIGEEPIDADPRTDEDVDIDTPAPGDN